MDIGDSIACPMPPLAFVAIEAVPTFTFVQTHTNTSAAADNRIIKRFAVTIKCH